MASSPSPTAKDLIKTSGGKYVAPQMIEGQLKLEPLVSQAVVIGDRRKYITALIAANLDVARKLLTDRGESVPDPAQLAMHAAVKKISCRPASADQSPPG